MSSSLGPDSRAGALARAENEVFDLLVVGAGATGTGTALDAAARGLSVLLIDKGDIAGGTSSRSSQLVHGGLRYLQHGDVALVRESLRERDLLLTTLAPDLVRPLPFLLPLRRRAVDRAYLGAGLALYDLLNKARALPRHRHLTRRGAIARFPDITPTIVGALEYYDAKMDDAMLAVAIARTAAERGAYVAPHLSMGTEHERDGEGVWHVRARNELTGEMHPVRSRQVALCTGVWTPEVSAGFTHEAERVSVVRSKGVHLRLPRSAIDGHTALIVPTQRSVLFVIPERDHWLVGTTDTEWTEPPDEVRPDADDVDYLLEELAGALARPVAREEVTWTFAGLRPLARDEAVGGDTTKVTREHRVTRVAPGVLAMVGGKWTTYRVMAEDLVDELLRDSHHAWVASSTDTIPLVASRPAEVRALIAEDPMLAEPLATAPGFTRADVVQACVHDGACTLDDVVMRRLRLPLHLDSVTEGTFAEVEAVMAGALARC
jgi:glycerol-3-phosphate dehydrogenase